jgi:hypothetical protein
MLATLMIGLTAVGAIPAAAFEAGSPARADRGAELQRRGDGDDDRRDKKSDKSDKKSGKHDRDRGDKGRKGGDDGPRCLGLVVVCLG